MKVCGCVCHQKMENLETQYVTDSDQGLEMVKDAIEFLAFTMKKR